MNEVYPTEELEKKVIERFNSIDFHCIFCDNPDSLPKSIIEYKSPFSDFKTALTVTAFCTCKNYNIGYKNVVYAISYLYIKLIPLRHYSQAITSISDHDS